MPLARRTERRFRSGALAWFGVNIYLFVDMSLDELDAVEDVIEFQADNNEIGVVKDFVAQRRLRRSERRQGENTLVVYPHECSDRF
jgi:hypothetical protein